MANKKRNIDLGKIVVMFYQHQVLVKTLHFQTKYYGAHKALDVHLAAFTLLMDQFMEVAQGIYDKIQLKKIHISTKTLTDKNAQQYLKSFVDALQDIGNETGDHADLKNILDEITAITNQLIYLLTFT